MFLRAKIRKKDGKQHRYFSVVENRRVGQNRRAQRTVLYLGEINDSQEAIWHRTRQFFDESHQQYTTLSLFPEDREIPAESSNRIQVKLSEMELHRPRAFGNCWLGGELWGHVALGELLGADVAVAEKDRLYRCLDRILEHKPGLFQHLRERWQDLFQAQFDVLRYDLTSTYIEGEGEEIPKAKYGYSRDQRFDSKQVVIALVITPEGFPLAYEVMDGNTSDRTTLDLPWQKVRESVEVK